MRIPRGSAAGSAGSMGSVQSMRSRAESVYFDAYTGEDHVDEVVKFRNRIVTEATNVPEDGRKRKRQIENQAKENAAKKQREATSPVSNMNTQESTNS